MELYYIMYQTYNGDYGTPSERIVYHLVRRRDGGQMRTHII